MSIGLSTNKNSKSSKCQAFCSLWKVKPGANGFKWWDTNSPSPVVEDSLHHFCQGKGKGVRFCNMLSTGIPRGRGKEVGWMLPLLPGLLHGFQSVMFKRKMQEARGTARRTKDLFLPEQSSFCQVPFWFFSGTCAYKCMIRYLGNEPVRWCQLMLQWTNSKLCF